MVQAIQATMNVILLFPLHFRQFPQCFCMHFLYFFLYMYIHVFICTSLYMHVLLMMTMVCGYMCASTHPL